MEKKRSKKTLKHIFDTLLKIYENNTDTEYKYNKHLYPIVHDNNFSFVVIPTGTILYKALEEGLTL